MFWFKVFPAKMSNIDTAEDLASYNITSYGSGETRDWQIWECCLIQSRYGYKQLKLHS